MKTPVERSIERTIRIATVLLIAGVLIFAVTVGGGFYYAHKILVQDVQIPEGSSEEVNREIVDENARLAKDLDKNDRGIIEIAARKVQPKIDADNCSASFAAVAESIEDVDERIEFARQFLSFSVMHNLNASLNDQGTTEMCDAMHGGTYQDIMEAVRAVEEELGMTPHDVIRKWGISLNSFGFRDLVKVLKEMD